MIAQAAIAALLVLSGLFGLIAALGLLRLPDIMLRLHAQTLVATLGTGAVLAASMLYQWHAHGRLSLHESLITLFLFLATPLTTLMIAKLHLHRPKPPPTPEP